jgi:hypothetical protein
MTRYLTAWTNSGPFSFVCSYAKELNTPFLIRTYDHKGAVDNPSLKNCRIWQAARATSAAATFFDPIQIGRQNFVDGGTGMNNPVEHVLNEAKSLWPDTPIQCIVSVGTGKADLKDFGENLKEIVETLQRIATETDLTHQRFLANCKYYGLNGRYFRFEVQQGLGNVNLDEHEKIGTIEIASVRYLGTEETKACIESFISVGPPDHCR